VRHLRAENRSGRTIATYLVGLRQADAFLRARGITIEIASTAATYYKPLKLLYAWLAEEEEIAADPMRRMKRPMVHDKPVRLCRLMGSSGCFAPEPATPSRRAATPAPAPMWRGASVQAHVAAAKTSPNTTNRPTTIYPLHLYAAVTSMPQPL
jgi:hypothetical protein